MNLNYLGIYEWADGRKYEGSWIANKMDGQGHFKWLDGRYYQGQYKNDKKHGWGSFVWPDGRKYDGNWVDGKQDGEGYFFSQGSASAKKGEWKEGRRIKWL